MNIRYFALVFLLLAGCAARVERTPFQPIDRSLGRALLENRKEAVVFDFIVESDKDHRVRLAFSKENSGTLLVFERTHGTWVVTRADGRRVWSGPSSDAPPALAIWMAIAEAWEAGKHLGNGETEAHTPLWRCYFRKKAGHLAEVIVVPAEGGERARVQFRKGNGT